MLNVALKQAIFATRKKQKTIARLARIGEVHMSRIVRGRRKATEPQQQRLSNLLGQPVSILFPSESAGAS